MAVKARAEITLSSIRDVQSVTRYYLLQSSTSAVPSKPTTNPPGGSWATTEPTYTSGSTNSLYFTDCTVFSDDTFVYSDVSLSSSYEAAKVAYNKAAGAENVANSANEKIDATDSRVRELVTDGANLIIGTTYPDASSDETLPRIFGQTHATRHGNTVVSVAEHGFRATNNGTGYTYIVFGNSAASGLPPGMHGLVAGETYTLSADVTCKQLSNNTNTTTYYLRCNYYDDSNTTGTMALKTYKNVISITKNDRGVEKSGRCEFTFTIQPSVTMCYVGFWCTRTTAAEFQAGDFIELRNIKLEKGSVATPWCSPIDWNEAVTAAQETANGKNTVYYQAEAPSGGTYKTNDIWFDTNNGNKMYMWNGSTWVAEQFGNAAISDLSITNAKIANGTIESAKISNLDAGKVTSGTMSAARIKGDELKLGGDNDADGVMKVYNADGDLVGSFTKEGLMAIAGTIAGWTIEEDALTGTQVVGTQHWETRISKADGIRFKEYPQGSDPTVDWTRETYYNKGLASYSSKENGETHTGAIENYPGEDGLRIYPKLTVGEHGGLAQTDITQNQIDTSVVRLKELWAHPLGTGDTFYLQQPVMIMAGVKTINQTGTSTKSLTLCTIPTEYQSGYRIVPFVSRRYGSASGVPSDDGDFYYAYYNSVSHDVCIKLVNKLPTGVIYQFDYMIYVLPET